MPDENNIDEHQRIVDYPVDSTIYNSLFDDAHEQGLIDPETGEANLDLSNFAFNEGQFFRLFEIALPFQNTATFGWGNQIDNPFLAAAQLISNVITVLPEERPVTGIGSNVKKMLFEPRTEEWETNLYNEIKSACELHIPAIIITKIKVIDNESKANPRLVRIEKASENALELEVSFAFREASEMVENASILVDV